MCLTRTRTEYNGVVSFLLLVVDMNMQISCIRVLPKTKLIYRVEPAVDFTEVRYCMILLFSPSLLL